MCSSMKVGDNDMAGVTKIRFKYEEGTNQSNTWLTCHAEDWMIVITTVLICM